VLGHDPEPPWIQRRVPGHALGRLPSLKDRRG
jgi:hypothetical protein